MNNMVNKFLLNTLLLKIISSLSLSFSVYIYYIYIYAVFRLYNLKTNLTEKENEKDELLTNHPLNNCTHNYEFKSRVVTY